VLGGLTRSCIGRAERVEAIDVRFYMLSSVFWFEVSLIPGDLPTPFLAVDIHDPCVV
jgi:hypothetical protein